MSIQKKKLITCKDCNKDYWGHHLTKLCDNCRFQECKAPGCTNTMKKSSAKKYCSAECRKADPAANTIAPEKRKTTTCPCGNVFRRYSGSGRQNPGSRRKYCSDECAEKYYTRPPMSEDQKRKISEAKKGKPTKLRGYKQSEEHLRKRLGDGSIRPSSEELALIPTLMQYGYRHTGDGAVWKRWPDGSPHNPDFINDENRSIVEYFGYCWHAEDWGKESYIRAQWKAIGYDCLILWDDDRENFIKHPDFWNIDRPDTWAETIILRMAPAKSEVTSWAPRGQKKLKPPRTHCIRGHLLADPNLREDKKKIGAKVCLACAEANWILRTQKDLDMQVVADACYLKITEGVPNPYRRTKSEAHLARVAAGQNYLASKTHCVRGHLLQEPNLDPYFLKQGHRKCRSCDKARSYIRSHGGDRKEISDRFYRELGMGEPL